MNDDLIAEARVVCLKSDGDAAIVIVFKGDSYITASYGKDKSTCEAFGKVCDQIHDAIAEGAIEIPSTACHP